VQERDGALRHTFTQALDGLHALAELLAVQCDCPGIDVGPELVEQMRGAARS
jgi:hypothetical protein